ncbi:MAG: signal peptidase I [Patescibacteria group bacterium]
MSLDPISPTPTESLTHPTRKSEWQELLRFALTVLIVVVPIRLYVVQPFIVSGESMHPTFSDGEYLIVDEVSYRFQKPTRGETIIFRPPLNTKKFYIKRIVGLPKETISISDTKVIIKNADNPDGFILDESYVKVPWSSTLTKTLGDNEYFVMGDNRSASSDSRVWGALPEDNIIGRPLVRLYPLKTIEAFPGTSMQKTSTN